jgi:prepilin-type N-terminal cleavage/methylation domain-containing protein
MMRNERGYTLAEMMVVCAIVGLVMASLLGLVLSGQQAFWYGTTQVDAQQTARVALERMVKEIREAGYYPQPPTPLTTGSCSTLICYAYNFDAIATGLTATAVTLQYDWNGDGASAASAKVNDPFLCATGSTCRGERVAYAFSSGALTRQEMGVDVSPVAIASGISSLTFTYFDEAGATTTVPADVRTIGVTLTAQSASQGAYVTMSDRIRLRNR